MDSRAADLIKGLGLTPHPEGGFYREIFRSASRVQPLDGRTDRLALTTIYFLLVAGQVSRWHRVASDEVWHHYEGGPLEVLVADAGFHDVSRRLLGPVGDNRAPVHVVMAGPGFEFADFEMLDSLPEDAAALRRRHPGAAEFI